MRRTRVRLAVAFAVFVFLALSALLARALTGAGSERKKVLALVQAEARGDAAAVLDRLPACKKEPACASVTAERVRVLRRPGRVQILNYDPSTQVALSTTTGTGRVAWRAGTSLPIVQCVRVTRDDPLSGGGAELLSISAPIAREGSCP
jgi:hypothetical protein